MAVWAAGFRDLCKLQVIFVIHFVGPGVTISVLRQGGLRRGPVLPIRPDFDTLFAQHLVFMSHNHVPTHITPTHSDRYYTRPCDCSAATITSTS